MSRFPVFVFVSVSILAGTLGCRSSDDTTVSAEETPPAWQRNDSPVDIAIRAEVHRMEAEEEKAADKAAEKGKKKKKGKGFHPFRSMGYMLQGVAIVITLIAGFFFRIKEGSGPFQSGASIALASGCFFACWVVFGPFSFATGVAFVVAAWEPLWWLMKWLKARGGAAPAAP